MPVYFAMHAGALWEMRMAIAVASAGVIAGTVLGGRLLRQVPEQVFRKVVAVLLGVLGVWLLAR
jgi:uncharacterized membrane protein YfcA